MYNQSASVTFCQVDTYIFMKGGIQVDDKKIVCQLKKKKEKALSVLVDRYSAYVSTVVRNIADNRLTESDIEEISADVFIIIWRNADKLRSESLRSYLAAVARNLSIDRLRKLHITIPIDEIEIYDNTDIEFNAEQHDLADVFNAIIDKMEQRDREILLRHYFYYQKIPQIALEMNMSQSACKTALHRARNKLKKKLIERGYGNEN